VLENCRILIVEDESLVAMFMEDLLGDLGYTVAGIAARLEAAIATPPETYDVAILDVHLAGKPVFPFAEILVQRGVPFVFASGYGEQGLPEAFRGSPVLAKPFQPNELQTVLSRITGKAG